MKTISKDKFIIMSSSCKVVDGKFRGVIIDYLRRELFYINKEYCSLFKFIDRKKIIDIEQQMENKESIEHLHHFLSFLFKKELAFTTDDVTLFPRISEMHRQSPCSINNCILTINTDRFELDTFFAICKELEYVNCFEVQIRIVGTRWIEMIQYICETLSQHGVRYLEIVCKHDVNIKNKLNEFVTNIPLLSRIFVFNAETNIVKEVSNNKHGDKKLTYGEIFYTQAHYDPVNSCGIINKQSLDFSSIHAYHKYRTVNGCLYKKVSINEIGEVKNCPSQSKSFGNIKNTSLREIIQSQEFTQLWYITKDAIEHCKDCELRYCCSDCRIFIENPNNIYSKPIRCNYNIKHSTWI